MHTTLLQGEIELTINIILGLIIGEIIIRLGLPDILLKRFSRLKIPSVSALAAALSTASSKTGAAMIASSLEKNQISEREAIWSVLMLSFPAYFLRRWPRTCTLAVSMAGKAGLIFALALILESGMRFFVAYLFLRNMNKNLKNENEKTEINISLKENFAKNKNRIIKRLLTTLPYAWIFFALAYSLVPGINKFFESNLKIFSFLPLSGWTVAAGSVAHVSAALGLAGGALASGELNTVQAAFALILGNGLGTATRLLRMNAGYYFGFFPPNTAKKMLITNFITIISINILILIFMGLVLLFY